MPNFKKEIVKRLLKKRIVVLTGEISAGSLGTLKENLLYLSSRSNEGIKILIDTRGGGFDSGLHFFDFLKALKPELTGIVFKRCDSTGVVILQACKNRLATPHSRFLIHSISLVLRVSSSEKTSDLHKKFQERLISLYKGQEIMGKILVERTKLSEKEIKNLVKKGDKDIDIMAEAAKEMGIIDKIISDFKVDLTS